MTLIFITKTRIRTSIFIVIVKRHGNLKHYGQKHCIIVHRKYVSNKHSLNKQIFQINTFMSWNGYPKRVRNSVIKRIETNRSRSRLTDNDYRKRTWLQSG